jgi:hypothetical protein
MSEENSSVNKFGVDCKDYSSAVGMQVAKQGAKIGAGIGVFVAAGEVYASGGALLPAVPFTIAQVSAISALGAGAAMKGISYYQCMTDETGSLPSPKTYLNFTNDQSKVR